MIYFGILNEVKKANIGIACDKCKSKQMQLVKYLEGDVEYKCRRCKELKKGYTVGDKR